MTMSFTMNWKVTSARTQIRFDQGEPLFQVIPIATNVCADFEQAKVRYMKLDDDPEVAGAYHAWKDRRRNFREQKNAGQLSDADWQKDYFQARRRRA